MHYNETVGSGCVGVPDEAESVKTCDTLNRHLASSSPLPTDPMTELKVIQTPEGEWDSSVTVLMHVLLEVDVALFPLGF